jgi:hypothetical protein
VRIRRRATANPVQTDPSTAPGFAQNDSAKRTVTSFDQTFLQQLEIARVANFFTGVVDTRDYIESLLTGSGIAHGDAGFASGGLLGEGFDFSIDGEHDFDVISAHDLLTITAISASALTEEKINETRAAKVGGKLIVDVDFGTIEGRRGVEIGTWCW